MSRVHQPNTVTKFLRPKLHRHDDSHCACFVDGMELFVCFIMRTRSHSDSYCFRPSRSVNPHRLHQPAKQTSNHSGSNRGPSIVLDILYIKLQIASCGRVTIYTCQRCRLWVRTNRLVQLFSDRRGSARFTRPVSAGRYSAANELLQRGPSCYTNIVLGCRFAFEAHTV